MADEKETPQAADTAPEATPAPEAPAPAPAKPADDPFGAAAVIAPAPAAAAPVEVKAEVNVDDLFQGLPAAKEPVAEEAAPEAAAPAPAPAAAPSDDPFGAADDRAQDNRAQSALAVRDWTDNTGTFKTTGRLVNIGDDSIRILKANGRTTTVPMRRLSASDRELVELVAKTLGSGEVGQVASR